MKIVAVSRHSGRSGFTLLESMVSLSIFAVVGYSLAVVVDVGNDSQRSVIRVATEDRSLREASTLLIDELRSSTDSTITVATLGDGNSQLQFRMPIEVGSALSWGVYDKSLGATYADQNKADWSLRYTVRNAPNSGGVVNRQLVRQILDEQQVVQKETVVAEGLRSGTVTPAGFRVVQTGDVWDVTVSTVGEIATKVGMEAGFHVQTRN